MKNVLLLGASGLIAPHIIPGLEQQYNLRLADIKPHPDGKPTLTVDVTQYDQVLEAARGMDAILNFTVNRPHHTLSFHVNTLGAHHVMKAAAELGIRKVVHTGPAMVLGWYDADFDIPEAPHAPSTDYYLLTKHLSYNIVETYARVHKIHTVCYLFTQLGPKPAAPVKKQSINPFYITYDDLVHACQLGLDLPEVRDYYQLFNLHSYPAPGKYTLEKAERLLGYRPQADWGQAFKRNVSTEP